MGRAGRYTLSVMAWVAAYAGWSSICGLVVAALTGDEAKSVSVGVSAVFIPLLVSVPTLVALWFNDWARDGFPTREQRAKARDEGGAGRSGTRLEERSGASVTELPAPPQPQPEDVAPEEVPAGFPVAPLLRDRLDLDGG